MYPYCKYGKSSTRLLKTQKSIPYVFTKSETLVVDYARRGLSKWIIKGACSYKREELGKLCTDFSKL